MSRKWTNVYFEVGSRIKEVPEASHDPRTRGEALNDFLKQKFGEDHIPNVRGVDVMFGRLDEEQIKEKVEVVFEEFEFANKAAAIYCTDSAHIGSGWIFTRDSDGSAKLEEEYQGYEGANGEDVRGRMEDSKYSISVDPMWYWD